MKSWESLRWLRQQQLFFRNPGIERLTVGAAPQPPLASIVRPLLPRMPESAMSSGPSGSFVPRRSARAIRSASSSLVPISASVSRS